MMIMVTNSLIFSAFAAVLPSSNGSLQIGSVVQAKILQVENTHPQLNLRQPAIENLNIETSMFMIVLWLSDIEQSRLFYLVISTTTA